MGTALITGITGQDGGYLAEQLARSGDAVHGLVRPGEERPDSLFALGDAVVLHPVNLSDDAAVARALRNSAATEVYNLAGVSSVALSWEQPGLTAEVNGTFVARLLQLVWQEQERRGEQIAVVQASSAEIFADAAVAPQDESTPMSPRTPYGASKAFAHHLVQVFRARGMQASNAILYNHESPRRPPSFVTRKITRGAVAVARGEQTTLRLGNLDARRDWGFAGDVVRAMPLALRAGTPDDYVIATGEVHTVRDWCELAFARVGLDYREHVVSDPAFWRPEGGVPLAGDASRARDRLDWRPQVDFAALVEMLVTADQAAPLQQVTG